MQHCYKCFLNYLYKTTICPNPSIFLHFSASLSPKENQKLSLSVNLLPTTAVVRLAKKVNMDVVLTFNVA